MSSTLRVLIALLAGCPVVAQNSLLQLTPVVTGISNPTDIQNPEDGSNRLFVVQQDGVIRVVRDGSLLPAPFLSISNRVLSGGERGLLGLAFPPGFAQKQYFYVNYTRAGDGATVVARYRVTSNPDIADPNSEQILLTVPQPFANHNGGQLQFGPDGFLYIGLGDGGSANDPLHSGQSLSTLLGKLLRVDVESDLNQITIPPTNPFVNNASALPEIWAFGLRNPWRFSFDRATGDLYIADVGQNRLEEINSQPAGSAGGRNYGWNIMEGTQCFNPSAPSSPASCDKTSLVLPVFEYSHNGNCSITGGYVYRGQLSPGLRGMYLYGDHCSGLIWGLRREGDQWVNRLLGQGPLRLTTFGQDANGEIYVGSQSTAEILRISSDMPPAVTPQSVVNAASNVPGLVAGSAATVYLAGALASPGINSASSVPLPTAIGGLSVMVGGQPAPLYATAFVNGLEQINFQVPFEAAGTEVPVVIRRGSAESAPVMVPLLPAQPGIFANGQDGILVFNSDFSLVTPANPASAGTDVVFYATGLGPVTNAPPTGAPAPREPLAQTIETPSVTLGGVPCEVQFAGLAPDFVGVYQVNFRVPQGVPPGMAELVVTSGGVASPPVRVAIK